MLGFETDRLVRSSRKLAGSYSAMIGIWLVVLYSIVSGFLYAAGPAAAASPAKVDIAFLLWRDGLWPDAQVMSVSRATFDRAFEGITPDMSLPDLIKPGEKPRPGRGQAEFSKTPEKYLSRSYLMKLAGQGQKLHAQYLPVLRRIEARFGVPRAVVLAIWGRETAYGTYRLRHNAIRALATQAYLGRRKAMFRKELLFALKMLEDKVATLKDMRSSWAGALGLTQTMPSEYYTETADMDGDGRRDIWRSVPDALGSAAKQLKNKGWVPGQSWGYEVTLKAPNDCSLEGPKQARTLGAWQTLGLQRTRGRKFSPALQKVSAYLMSPAGSHGPSFLVTENFSVIKRYNPSDLYALFVGHLADRIGSGGDFSVKWAPIKQLRRSGIAQIQERLKSLSYAIGKVDGLIGSNTRAQIGLYQKRNRLQINCWPSRKLLRHLQAVALK